MSKFLTGLLVALAIALAGCGGGGGSTTPTDTGGGTTKDPTERILTGTVINSVTGTPVANVLVSMGPTYTAETGLDGTFKLGPIPIADEILSTFIVDVSGAGAGYNREYLVSYNLQDYDYNKIDMPVSIRNGDSDDLGVITVKYASDETPTIPYPIHDTVIAGRVVRSDVTSIGIAGVTVTFGTAVITRAVTGTGGYFALNVGRDVDVNSLFISAKTFSISVPTGSVPGLVGPVRVSYGGVTSAANNILVPEDVLANDSTDIGNVVVMIGTSSDDGSDDGGGGDGPPGQPF